MFGLIKTLAMVVVLFVLIGVGLAYLPPETQTKVTTQVADLAVKGCRGGKMLYDAFKQKMEEEEALTSTDARGEILADAGSEAAD
jgi:hypothetical protein